MAGSPKRLSIGGVTFKMPIDCNPNVIKGGVEITETEVYGDGTVEPIKTVVPGKITGMVVSTKDAMYDSLMSFAGKENLAIVYESSSKSYEFTGFISKSEGIENDTAKDKTTEFELISQSGPIRSS